MKKERVITYIIVFLLAVMAVWRSPLKHRSEPTPLPIQHPMVPRPKPPQHVTGDLGKFLKKMGRMEGLGSYQIVSRSGYLGLYQFHPRTLKLMGFTVTKEEFLNNPVLQDSAMILFMKDNARELKHVIQEFEGTYYNGIYITRSGIIAGAHLVGQGGILSFFYPDKYKYRTVDGNGMNVATYIEKFAGYKLRGI